MQRIVSQLALHHEVAQWAQARGHEAPFHDAVLALWRVDSQAVVEFLYFQYPGEVTHGKPCYCGLCCPSIGRLPYMRS